MKIQAIDRIQDVAAEPVLLLMNRHQSCRRRIPRVVRFF
jgi:hypothetical protein